MSYIWTKIVGNAVIIKGHLYKFKESFKLSQICAYWDNYFIINEEYLPFVLKKMCSKTTKYWWTLLILLTKMGEVMCRYNLICIPDRIICMNVFAFICTCTELESGPPPLHLLEISNFYNIPHPFTGIMLDSVGLMVIYMIGCKQGMYSSTYYWVTVRIMF